MCVIHYRVLIKYYLHSPIFVISICLSLFLINWRFQTNNGRQIGILYKQIIGKYVFAYECERFGKLAYSNVYICKAYIGANIVGTIRYTKIPKL